MCHVIRIIKYKQKYEYIRAEIPRGRLRVGVTIMHRRPRPPPRVTRNHAGREPSRAADMALRPPVPHRREQQAQRVNRECQQTRLHTESHGVSTGLIPPSLSHSFPFSLPFSFLYFLLPFLYPSFPRLSPFLPPHPPSISPSFFPPSHPPPSFLPSYLFSLPPRLQQEGSQISPTCHAARADWLQSPYYLFARTSISFGRFLSPCDVANNDK